MILVVAVMAPTVRPDCRSAFLNMMIMSLKNKEKSIEDLLMQLTRGEGRLRSMAMLQPSSVVRGGRGFESGTRGLTCSG